MASEYIASRGNDMFVLALLPCRCDILADILDPSVPFVWIRRHIPQRYVEWNRMQVPFSRTGKLYEAEVRWLEFDLHLPTDRFLDVMPEFNEHGIVLFQMSRHVPDTLTLDRVQDDMVDRVLVQNGMHLRFFLPHAGECAQLASPDIQVLERALDKPRVRQLAYRP